MKESLILKSEWSSSWLLNKGQAHSGYGAMPTDIREPQDGKEDQGTGIQNLVKVRRDFAGTPEIHTPEVASWAGLRGSLGAVWGLSPRAGPTRN